MPLPSRRRRLLFLRDIRTDRRGVTAVEAAIILPVFLVFLLVLFEVAYDQFLQGILESTVQYTSYQVQVGNTINTGSAQAFVDGELCPNTIAHLLNCGNIYVRVQQFNTTGCTDFYQDTDGTLPVSGGVLQLGDYAGEQPGAGSAIGPNNTACSSGAATAGVGFCNPGPNEYIIMTAIYVAPTFLDELIPGQAYTYNGSFVHAAYASSAFYTENFSNTNTNPPSPC